MMKQNTDHHPKILGAFATVKKDRSLKPKTYVKWHEREIEDN